METPWTPLSGSESRADYPCMSAIRSGRSVRAAVALAVAVGAVQVAASAGHCFQSPASPSSHGQAAVAPAFESERLEFPSRPVERIAVVAAPANVTFVYEPGTPVAARQLIETAAALAIRYFESSAGLRLRPVTLLAGGSTDWLIDEQRGRARLDGERARSLALRWPDAGGMTTGHVVGIRLQDDWVDGDWSYAIPQVVRSIGHEFAHVLQSQLSTRSDALAWLEEGQAELEAATMLEAYGMATIDAERETAAIRARGTDVALAGLLSEAAPGLLWPYIYPLGFLAVDFAVGTRESAVMWDYWRALAAGGPDDAFTATFETTVADFEVAFQAHRDANFPPYRGVIEGRIIGGAFDAAHDVQVVVCVESSMTPDVDDDVAGLPCVYLTVAPNGEFRARVSPGRYFLVVTGEPWGGYYVAGESLALVIALATVIEVAESPTRVEIRWDIGTR